MLIELVKTMFIDLESDSMMIPWVYLCFNRDMSLSPLEPKYLDTIQKKNPQNSNSSKLLQQGTSTNINKSAGLPGGPNATSNQLNSNINDSAVDIDMEFGYMTDEESIFHSFTQEVERSIPRLNRQVTATKDPSTVDKEIKDVLKRVSYLAPLIANLFGTRSSLKRRRLMNF